MDKVVQAIKQGDRSTMMLGYAVTIDDPHLPFGKIIKSNFARALKHHIDSEKARLLLVYLAMPKVQQ